MIYAFILYIIRIRFKSGLGLIYISLANSQVKYESQ